MSAKFIPVENLHGYQRWQFIGIDDSPVELSEDVREDSPSLIEAEPDIPVEPQAVVEGPSAEDIGRIYHDAHREGYEAGLVEGLEAGHAEGFEAGRVEGLDAGRKAGYDEAVNAAKPLAALFDSFAASVELFNKDIVQDVVGLALEVSRQILRNALQVNPELIAPVVKGAMESMPPGAQHPHIHLHPEDAVLVRDLLKEDLSHGGWKIIEDHRIERGGCKIETSTAELDARLPSRWERIAQALGQDHSWLGNDK